tara:strand:+ start:1533 stop:2198 length:666 start_codon:yes stop_codon:yes gene_type:complete
MKKLICFSLWGENPIYTIGAIKNAELALELFPDWICRFYIGKSTPQDIIDKLNNFSNTENIIMDEEGNWEGMFWRFLPASETDVQIMLSRDCDSRLSQREKSAIDEWLNSDKDFHIMRDHPYHQTAILGGMWGARNSVIKDISKWINEHSKGDYWQVDQEFLRDVVYPKIKDNSFTHDEFFVKYNFPTKRENLFFIGQAFDENDKALHPEHVEILKQHIDV